MNTRFYNARILDKDFQIIQGELSCGRQQDCLYRS